MAANLWQSANPISNVGRGIGAIGGFLQPIFGQTKGVTALRNVGGQLSGGIRSFNLVPPVRAAEPQVLGGQSIQGGFSPWTPPPPGGNIGNGAGQGNPPAPTPTSQPPSQEQYGLGDVYNQIEADYNGLMTTLSGREAEAQQTAGTARQRVETEFAPARTQLQQEETTRLGTIGTREQETQQAATSSIAEARRIYNELQQQAIAQLSGAGISSSSVAEALAEKIGRQTAERIFTVAQTRDQAISLLGEERTKVKNYIGEKLSNLEQQKTLALQNVQDWLLNSLRDINTQRGVADAYKAQQRSQSLLDYKNYVNQINLDNSRVAQALNVWAQNKDNGLAQAASYVMNIPEDIGAQSQYNPQAVNLGQGQQQMGFLPTGTITRQGLSGRTPEEQLQPFGAGAVA